LVRIVWVLVHTKRVGAVVLDTGAGAAFGRRHSAAGQRMTYPVALIQVIAQ
jgi:hypothetical protein